TLTAPVLAHARATAHAAITAADLPPQSLHGVYCHGGGIPPAMATDALTDTPGPTPLVVPDPEHAALLGAVHARGHPSAPPAPPTLPAHWRGPTRTAHPTPADCCRSSWQPRPPPASPSPACTPSWPPSGTACRPARSCAPPCSPPSPPRSPPPQWGCSPAAAP